MAIALRLPPTWRKLLWHPRLGIAWQPVKALVVRAGGGFYYGPSPHMVGGTGLNSDGYSTQTTWDATCFNADGNTVFNGSSDSQWRCTGKSGAEFHRSLLT